jgi:glycosyltransferase involved in cell wall biosynthesis
MVNEGSTSGERRDDSRDDPKNGAGDTAIIARVKVLLVNTSYPPFVIGGAELSVQELAEDLAADGHVVRVLCLAPRSRRDAHRDADASPEPGRVSVRRLWRRRLHPEGRHPARWARALWHVGELLRLREYAALRAEIRQGRPDVVHLNNIAGFGWLAWLAVRRVPTVQTVRDYSLVCTSSFGEHNHSVCSRRSLRCRILKAPFTLSWLRPRRVVGVSDYVWRRMRAAGVRGRDDTPTIVRNRPRPSGDAAESATPSHRADGLPVVGYLGRLDADKGVGILHEAVRLLRAGGIEVRLLIAGGPTSYGRALTDRYALEYAAGACVQLGYVDPGDLLARCDVLAVPTQWHEPFGRVAAEALQAGTPVVASHVGGLPELADLYGEGIRTVTGFSDPGAWATALASALADGPRPTTPVPPPPAPAAAYLSIYADVRRGVSSAAGSEVGSAQVNARQS